MAFGVANYRVAVILAHGSVFDDPSDTPFNVQFWPAQTVDESWKIVRQSK